MKVKELKERLDKIEDPEMDVMVECGHNKHHVLSAKRMNYNKRDSKYTSRVFWILCK